MGDVFRKCAWIGCTNEFFPKDERQIYCCPECRERAKNYRRPRTYKEPKKEVKKCNREDCQIYSKTLANHCNGLTEVPDDLWTCGFYKKK